MASFLWGSNQKAITLIVFEQSSSNGSEIFNGYLRKLYKPFVLIGCRDWTAAAKRRRFFDLQKETAVQKWCRVKYRIRVDFFVSASVIQIFYWVTSQKWEPSQDWMRTSTALWKFVYSFLVVQINIFLKRTNEWAMLLFF